MQISIITITYNSVDTLKDAIESVLNQTCTDIEYIVVDGGSSDGTIDLLKQYGDCFKWISEPDTGIYNALNKGIGMAQGDYIGFLHADDVLADDTIVQHLKDAIDANEPDVIYGDLEYVSKQDTSKIIRYWKSNTFEPKMLKNGWMPPHPTVYIKNNWYKRLGKFNESFRIAADYDFMLRLFSQTNIKTAYLDKVIVKMRVGGESNRSVSNIIKKMKEDYRALKSNNIGGCRSLFLKNFSKLSQFISRKTN